jgi:uncharacterized protein
VKITTFPRAVRVIEHNLIPLKDGTALDRIGLELGTQYKTEYHVEENDPLSAIAELHQTQILSRNEWQIRVETRMRLSSTRNTVLLQGSLRAFEGANEVCCRDWDRSIPRDFL